MIGQLFIPGLWWSDESEQMSLVSGLAREHDWKFFDIFKIERRLAQVYSTILTWRNIGDWPSANIIGDQCQSEFAGHKILSNKASYHSVAQVLQNIFTDQQICGRELVCYITSFIWHFRTLIEISDVLNYQSKDIICNIMSITPGLN